jgi:streptomycin 6-kinase
VLKLGWVDDETIHEAAALKLWSGNGAVMVIDADVAGGALLLERLDSGCSLMQIPEHEATEIAAKLLRRLAVPVAGGFPSLTEYARRRAGTMRGDWERHARPFPEAYETDACTIAVKLGDSTANYLVNWDLHYENILAGKREPWLAIDPKVYAGDAEFGVAQLLWKR